MDYRCRVEFEQAEYEEIDAYCRNKNIAWFASCWDEPSVDFIEQFNPPAYKIPSAALTDAKLLHYLRKMERSLILSTGMSSLTQVHAAVQLLTFGVSLVRKSFPHCSSCFGSRYIGELIRS